MPDNTLDPEVLEFLEEESAGMNEHSDAFFQRYGFRHTCRCDKDYAENNTAHVPMCWVEMMDISFDRLAQNRAFLRSLLSEHALDEDFPTEEIADFLTRE